MNQQSNSLIETVNQLIADKTKLSKTTDKITTFSFFGCSAIWITLIVILGIYWNSENAFILLSIMCIVGIAIVIPFSIFIPKEIINRSKKSRSINRRNMRVAHEMIKFAKETYGVNLRKNSRSLYISPFSPVLTKNNEKFLKVAFKKRDDDLILVLMGEEVELPRLTSVR